MKLSEPCPCGLDKTYQDCCYPYHDGTAVAQSPEALMRSRYSAFVGRLGSYLEATWHSSSRPALLDLSDSPNWLKLQVLSSSMDQDKGQVHFRAFYRDGDDVAFMEEKSDFVHEDGKWYYVEGKVS
ncbi:YchJ family protein [Idiomarina sp. HP20-50]|uniref:YchJ family protein n=1 Tax=Idiomarina sp. HP20-50 TaxID=3070813 RepID=UPI00294B92B8|nr:YchJ family metal-binding protein [Idiomarina sp. HP20-50]MDV6317026.1 YchJ family metal-binding protein [Idiomarina sp. HP20-50]